MFKLVTLLALAPATLVHSQAGDEVPCGLTTSIKCTDSSGAESCKFDQIPSKNKNAPECFEPAIITAKVCNEFNQFNDVTVLEPESMVELTGNAWKTEDFGIHPISEQSLSQGECITKTFDTEINICKKTYNVYINADATIPSNNNCRAEQFKKYSNKRYCDVSTSVTCTTPEGTVCADTTYTRDTCGVMTLTYVHKFCNLNKFPPVSIKPVIGSTKAWIGRDKDNVPIDEGILGPDECSTYTSTRTVNTCKSFAPHADMLLNAKILGSDGTPDTINNQHCYSNTYLPGTGWGLEVTGAPTTSPTYSPTPATAADKPAEPAEPCDDAPAAAPASKGKGCTKGMSKGSKGASGPTGRRRRQRKNRRHL